jgi:hypothetical protein
MSFMKKHKYLLLILTAAFIIRILYFIIANAMSGGTYYYSAATGSYLLFAEAMIGEGLLFSPRNAFDIFRTPGYPLVLVPFMIIMGASFPIGVTVFQIMLNITAIFCLYKLCLLLGARHKTALLAALLASLNPLDTSYACRVQTDSMTQSLMVFALYFYTRFLLKIRDEKADLRLLVLGSLFLSYSVLTRPVIMYLPLAFFAGFVFILILHKQYKRILPVTLIVLLITYLPMGGWCLRNTVMTDYSGYAIVGVDTFYKQNSAIVYAKQKGIDYYAAQSILYHGEDEGLQKFLDVMPKYEAYAARTKELIASDIPTYLKGCLVGIACLFVYPGTIDYLSFMDTGIADMIVQVKEMLAKLETSASQLVKIVFASETLLPGILLLLDAIVLFVLLLFALIGVIKAKWQAWYIKVMFLGTIAYMVLACCQPISYGAYSRYRLSFSMLMLVFVAFGVEAVQRGIYKKRKK